MYRNIFAQYIPDFSTSETQDNITILPLEIFQCHVTNLPESGIDCSLSYPNICVKCSIKGVYLTGENLFTKSLGYLICQVVLILSIFIAFVGILANSLTIIIISRKRKRNKKVGGFDLVLLWLACTDLFCCLSAAVACSAHVVYLGELNYTKCHLSEYLKYNNYNLRNCIIVMLTGTLPESSEWLLNWLHVSQMILNICA